MNIYFDEITVFLRNYRKSKTKNVMVYGQAKKKYNFCIFLFLGESAIIILLKFLECHCDENEDC